MSREPSQAESDLVLVTGTSRGVGRALAESLAERGLRLALVGRRSDAQKETERLLQERGTRYEFFPCDLSDWPGLDEVAREVCSRMGVPSVVVHNAAVIERAPVQDTSLESWKEQLDVNLSAPFALTRALLPKMLAKKRGRILFVSSISAVVGTRNQSAYHASKAGLVGLMRCLAEELSDTGVMTAALLPGSVDTRMLAESRFSPRMSPREVADTLTYYALEGGLGHNGAIIEMFGV